MPDMGFMDQWVVPILAEDKPFTLRRAWQNGRTPDIGAKLGLVTGNRTAQRRRFAWAICEFRCAVEFSEFGLEGFYDWREVEICGPAAETVRNTLRGAVQMPPRLAPLYGAACAEFAQLDGFPDYAAFWDFHARHRAEESPSVCRRELIGFGCITPEYS